MAQIHPLFTLSDGQGLPHRSCPSTTPLNQRWDLELQSKLQVKSTFFHILGAFPFGNISKYLEGFKVEIAT
jgi:hypothetical protein